MIVSFSLPTCPSVRFVDPDGEPSSKKCFREKASDDFTGQTVWASSVLLGRWVLANADSLEGRSVLEIGSGCGLAGLAAARCTNARAVCLSDFASATMANLANNVDANCTRWSALPLDNIEADLTKKHWVAEGGGSGTACEVRIARMNWDDEDTWPSAARDRVRPPSTGSAGEDGADPRDLFDVVLAADVLYRRSYARKVAAVVRGVLRPGGILVSVSPAMREGLSLLRRLMTEAGAVTEEVPLPEAWHANPLRSPSSSSSTSIAHTEVGGGTSEVVRRPAPPASWDCSDCTSSGSQPTLVSDDAARGLFPELFIPGYEMTCLVFTLPDGKPGARPM